MLTLLSLGSGSCGNCYYIANENDAIVVDCGVGIRRFRKTLMDYGLKIGKIRGMFITHDHADHIKAAGKVSNEYNIPVHATALVHEGMDRNYQASIKVKVENRRTIETDNTVQVGDFKVTAFSVPHDATDSVGYFIEANGVSLSIMTDVGDVTDNVKKYIGLSSHIILEANYDTEMLAQGRYPAILKDRITSGRGHLSNDKCAQALAENFHENLKNVWLCHLSEENNHPELARKTIESILRGYGIISGVDFNLQVLRRKIPTGPFELQV